MLVLSRRVGERLVIGDDIVITIIDVRSDGVRIGIDAPRNVRVNRAEVLEAVTNANLEAARSADDAAEEALKALRPPTPPTEKRAREPPPASGDAPQDSCGDSVPRSGTDLPRRCRRPQRSTTSPSVRPTNARTRSPSSATASRSRGVSGRCGCTTTSPSASSHVAATNPSTSTVAWTIE